MLQQLTFVDSVLLIMVFDYLQYAVNLAIKVYLNVPRGLSSVAPTRTGGQVNTEKRNSQNQ
jgi:hypothetical protein